MKEDKAAIYTKESSACFPLSFTVSGIAFRSLINFEFIFVDDVKECSGFILLHVAVQFS